MLTKLKFLAYSNILVSQMLFFSTFAIMGLTYAGSGESSIYTIYLVGSSFLAYFFFFWEVGSKVKFKPILPLLFLVPLIFLLFAVKAPAHSFVQTQTRLFFVLVLPATFVGYITARSNILSLINKFFIFAASLVFLAVLRILPRLISLPVIELMDVFGGGQYQAFSYFCAFSFLIFLRHSLYQNQAKLWLKLGYFFILLVLFAGVILSGGRGGMMVVVIGLIIFTFRKYGLLKFLRYSIIAALSITVVLYIAIALNFPFADRVSESFDRLFSFISSDGIDMEGTSNRDSFYAVATAKISESLIYGYGIFGLVEELGEYYPHNIFLEVLLQGGIILLIVFLVIMGFFFYKLSRLIKLKKDQDIILIPTIYSVVLLLFSSSYLQEPFFWFSIVYVFSCSINNINNKEIEIINPDFRISKPQ